MQPATSRRPPALFHVPNAIVIALLFICIAGPARGASTPPPASAIESAKIHRAMQIRALLLEAVEQSYRDSGKWPESFPPGGAGDGNLIYRRPVPTVPTTDRETLRTQQMIAAATVVLHEPIGAHPDGAWVGYADGHLEFAPSAERLADCENQLQLASQKSPEPATRPAPTPGELTLRVVDAEGKPVAGAEVGTYMGGGRTGPIYPPLRFYSGGEGEKILLTDDHGEVKLPAATVFSAKFSEELAVPVSILHRARLLMTTIDLQRSDFDQQHIRPITLATACHVHGKLTSVGLVAAGKTLEWTNVNLFKPGKLRWYTFNGVSKSQVFDFILPPGDYGLDAYGTDCDAAFRHFHIEPGERNREFELDIPSNTMTRLMGRSAPALQSIKGWKNGSAINLDDLHGKVVLLDFWGYWCGPCVGGMPVLMKLHDQFKDKGLVIIGVHDDSIDSIADMDEKLKSIRNAEWAGWKGRDLPFLIALDGGGLTRIKYTSIMTRGATTAAYGITTFPTTIAIGRDGNVIGEFSATSTEAAKEIEKMLAEN